MPGDQRSAARMANVPFSGIRHVFEECDRLEAAGRDVVHLEIGRPDFDTPEPIKRAAHDAIDDGRVHYTSNYGVAELRAAISDKFAADNGLDYDPDGEVVVTTGATEAVLVSILAFVGRGDEVLIPDPSWTYPAMVRLADGTPVRYELDPETGFQPSMAALERAVSDRSKLLIVNSPQNPTGSVIDRDTAEALRDFAVEHDLLVVSDEIYEQIRYDGRTHHSLAALDGLSDRTITVNGLSKAYSMTGWRLGYLGAPASLVDAVIRARQYTTTCAPSISQWAGVRALEGDLHEPLVAEFEARRDLVEQRLAAIDGMETPAPTGAFYAFPSVPSSFENGTEFSERLLQKAGVATVPGSVFGSVGEDRIRIAYSNSRERIGEAFDRIEAWL